MYYADLQKLPIFCDLSSNEIERFMTSIGALVRQYEKGCRILKAYSSNRQIGVMVAGEAQVITEDRFGNESISHTLDRGAMLGTASAILPQMVNAATIEALSDVLVLWVPYQALLTSGPKLGRIHGVVMKNLLEAFSRKNVLMMQKIELLSQKTLRERLILYLIQRERRQNTEQIRVPGRVQLARELECNRSALTREVRLMKQEGLLLCGIGWMRLEKKMIF